MALDLKSSPRAERKIKIQNHWFDQTDLNFKNHEHKIVANDRLDIEFVDESMGGLQAETRRPIRVTRTSSYRARGAS